MAPAVVCAARHGWGVALSLNAKKTPRLLRVGRFYRKTKEILAHVNVDFRSLGLFKLRAAHADAGGGEA